MWRRVVWYRDRHLLSLVAVASLLYNHSRRRTNAALLTLCRYAVMGCASGVGVANWQHVNEPTRINDVRRETMTISAAEFWNLLQYTSHCGQVASVRRGKRFIMLSEEMKGAEVDVANHVGQAEQSFYTEIYCLLVSYSSRLLSASCAVTETP